MGDTTGISWCDATFNPWIGCTKVSEGCKFCYAERENARYGWAKGWGPTGERYPTSEANWAKPLAWNRKAAQEGKRLRVFCASLADVFEDRPELETWRDDLFRLIEVTDHLDWLLLTKRPENVIRMLPAGFFLESLNVWIGTSAENQQRANERIPVLLDIPARVRFISVEPILGEVSLVDALTNSVEKYPIDWVICGGESGPSARPMDAAWARLLRDECKAADIPFHFKQWGEWFDGKRVGRSTAGYLLDGHEYKMFPGDEW